MFEKGTYQISSHRSERHGPDHEREAQHGDLAGDLVSRVPHSEACETIGGDDAGGEKDMNISYPI